MTPAAWPLPPRLSPASPTALQMQQASEASSAGSEQSVQAQSSLQTVLACRRFSSAFAAALQRGTTRAAAALPVSAAHLAEAFQAVDFEAVLDKDNADRVFREEYGIQSWLVGPERGVRALVAHCLELYREPMGAAAGAVRQALLAAADAALLALPDAGGSTCGADSPEELGCPPWLRQAILARAQACVRGWHSDTQRQLGALLEAEALCPAGERFEELKVKLAGLLHAPATAQIEADGAPDAPSAGASKQVLAAADQQLQAAQGAPSDASWMMGSLLKMSRRGRWQRRFFMLPRGQPALYYAKAAKADARTALDLAGAAVVQGVLPVAGSANTGSMHDSLTFHLQLAAPAAAGAGRQRAVMTLRAPSAGVKEAWVRQLRAAAAGSKEDKHVADATTAERPPGAGVPAVLLRTLSSASSASDDAAQAHAGGGGSSAVPRKISTRVFVDPPTSGPSTAAAAEADSSTSGSSADRADDFLAAAEVVGGEVAYGAGGRDDDASVHRTQHEAALLAAIDQLAASRQPAAEDAAVVAAAAEVVRGYVVEARARLLALTQRVVSAGMLLGREEALRQALLDVLLPEGCRPTWVGAD